MAKKKTGFRFEAYAKVKGPDGRYRLVKQPGCGEIIPREQIDPELRAFIENRHREFLTSMAGKPEIKKRKVA